MVEGLAGGTGDRLEIEVTGGGKRNKYLSLTGHLDFFPEDAIGPASRRYGQGALLTVYFAGIPDPIRTDIDGVKKGFRARGSYWTEFFDRHDLAAGDVVVVERRAAYEYHIAPLTSPAGGRSSPELNDPASLIEALSGLRVNRSSGSPASYQPIALLWAISRARRGAARITTWAETRQSLQGLLQRHGRLGERPRPDYPVAALFHAGVWELRGFTGPVPAAHGDAALRRWFDANAPDGGLAEPADDLIRRSGQARAQITAVIIDTYLAGRDCTALLSELGLADQELAEDLTAHRPDELPGDPAADYQRLCGIAGRRAHDSPGGPRPRTILRHARSAAARQAVLLRSRGQCENPYCPGQPQDVTDRGDPILEVDHIRDLARGGPDSPEQMIALCPNCHQVKTRGRTRRKLRTILLAAARERHQAWQPPA